MRHRALAVAAVLVLILAATAPGYAASRAPGIGRGGGMRSGGGSMGGGGKWQGGSNWHSGRNWHGHGCCWGGTRVFVGIGGGLAFGPWWWGYPYPYPYYAYPYPYSAYPAPATTSVAPSPSYAAPAQQTMVQREVVFPNGKYVLYGDGVNEAWQWVWVPSVETR